MLRKILSLLKHLVWILPGFLLWASFPPFGQCHNSFVALAPLLWYSRRAGTRRSARAWFLAGLLFWVATISWMPAIIKNGGPAALVALGWLVLAAYPALYFAVFGHLASLSWRWAGKGGYWRRLAAIVIAEPVLWAGLELIRSRLFGGFAWNQLGVAAVNCGFGAPAMLGGVYLVSACIVLVAGTFASVAERMMDPSQSAVPRYVRSIETLLPVLLVVLAFQCSRRMQSDMLATEPSRHMQVAMVQRNFPCVFDREHGARENPVDEYRKLYANIAPLRPELVLLCESALAEFGSIGSPRASAFLDFSLSQTGAKGILAGGGRRGEGREYNSAVLFNSKSSPIVYDKVHLVPFGEYIPFDKIFPWLQRFAPVGSCMPGELKTLDFDGLKLGVAICFEDTDSAQIRRLAAQGAQLLCFITNDSWFGGSEEAWQHAWQAVARAIETGLPVVRCGNSGVTGAISADGRPTWLAGSDRRPIVDEKGAMMETVAVPLGGDGSRTPYTRLGDVPLAVLFAAVLLVLAWDSRLRFLARRTSWRGTPGRSCASAA